MVDPLGFGDLIDPVTSEAFFERYWEQRPLHLEHPYEERFAALVDAADVETVVLTALGRADSSSGVVASRCLDGEPDYWDLPAAPANQTVHALLHAFADGYSIVVNSIDRFWAPLSALCRRIESALQQPVGANLYYSPAHTQGFPAHFDEHDVLVTQVRGDKCWDLFEAEPEALSGRADPWVVPGLSSAPTRRCRLGPGDVLYLPRGWAHRVTTGERPSLHITFGIRSLRWADLVLRAARAAVRADPELQRAIPLHDEPNATDLNERAAAMLASLVPGPADDPYRELMAEVHATRTPALTGQLAEIAASQTELTASTRLRRRPGLRPICTVDGDETTIRFAGNGVTAPASFAPAFELLCRRESIRVAELTAAAGDDARPLAHALVANGLLTRV